MAQTMIQKIAAIAGGMLGSILTIKLVFTLLGVTDNNLAVAMVAMLSAIFAIEIYDRFTRKQYLANHGSESPPE